MTRFSTIEFDEPKYITPEYLRILADEIESLPDQRVEATVLLNETSHSIWVSFPMTPTPTMTDDLSKIRRVMPTLIAHDIIGVAPMKPPSEEMLKPRQKMAESEGNKDNK